MERAPRAVSALLATSLIAVACGGEGTGASSSTAPEVVSSTTTAQETTDTTPETTTTTLETTVTTVGIEIDRSSEFACTIYTELGTTAVEATLDITSKEQFDAIDFTATLAPLNSVMRAEATIEDHEVIIELSTLTCSMFSEASLPADIRAETSDTTNSTIVFGLNQAVFEKVDEGTTTSVASELIGGLESGLVKDIVKHEQMHVHLDDLYALASKLDRNDPLRSKIVQAINEQAFAWKDLIADKFPDDVERIWEAFVGQPDLDVLDDIILELEANNINGWYIDDDDGSIFAVFFDDGNRGQAYPNFYGGTPQRNPSETNSSTYSYLSTNTHELGSSDYIRHELVIDEWLENYRALDAAAAAMVERMVKATVDVATVLSDDPESARAILFHPDIITEMYG